MDFQKITTCTEAIGMWNSQQRILHILLFCVCYISFISAKCIIINKNKCIIRIKYTHVFPQDLVIKRLLAHHCIWSLKWGWKSHFVQTFCSHLLARWKFKTAQHG